MNASKLTLIPLGRHQELTKKDYPVTDVERSKMAKISFDVVVGSVMYANQTGPDFWNKCHKLLYVQSRR